MFTILALLFLPGSVTLFKREHYLLVSIHLVLLMEVSLGLSQAYSFAAAFVIIIRFRLQFAL